MEDPEDYTREPDDALDFEALLARFQAKMAFIPADCRRGMGWLYTYRHIQDQRKRLGNRANQLSEGKRVFWATVLPPESLASMGSVIVAAVDPMAKAEETAARELHKTLRHTSWYREVAIPAAQGIGMSEGAGTLSAAKILWAFGAASRFKTFGCIIRYARLAPENGKAPGRVQGQRIHYNPGAWQALFDLSETWNRMPDCCWRLQWDAWKLYYRERYPETLTKVVKGKKVRAYPDGRIHNMGRRKMLREFLRGLYDLWLAWEARQQ